MSEVEQCLGNECDFRGVFELSGFGCARAERVVRIRAIGLVLGFN